MSYVQIVQKLPDEYRLTMLELIEAVEQHMREQLAVRRQDFDELRATVNELAEAQRRTEERLGRLEVVVTELAEAQRRTEETVRGLAIEQGRMRTDLASLKGQSLEQTYARKAPAYFGRWLRQVRVVLPGALTAQIENALEANLTPDEILEVLRADLIVRGRQRLPDAADELWLAVEVAAVVDRSDVGRARRRAALLRKAGFVALPVVAGESLTEGAEELIIAAPVVLVQNGLTLHWEETLARIQE